jgi:hypothetical protein
MGTVKASGFTSTDLAILAGAVLGLIFWILISYFVGRAADRKNRSFASFFLISFFVSPMVGAIIVAALPPTEEMLITKGRMRACEQCAEAIQPKAIVCPHCGNADGVSTGQHARHARS